MADIIKHENSLFRKVRNSKNNEFQSIFDSSSFQFEKVLNNLEEAIRIEYNNSRAKSNETFSYDKYQPLENIYQWIDDMAQQYPDIVSVINVATSFEKRQVKLMHLSVNNSGNITKPAIWLQGCIHSREWISTATVIWMTQAVKKYSNLQYSC